MYYDSWRCVYDVVDVLSECSDLLPDEIVSVPQVNIEALIIIIIMGGQVLVDKTRFFSIYGIMNSSFAARLPPMRRLKSAPRRKYVAHHFIHNILTTHIHSTLAKGY